MGFDNPTHIAILLILLLLVFGAKRLPEIGRVAWQRDARVQGLAERRSEPARSCPLARRCGGDCQPDGQHSVTASRPRSERLPSTHIERSL